MEPALKNLGAIAIPIVREVISPASFRNTDPEVTDITVESAKGPPGARGGEQVQVR